MRRRRNKTHDFITGGCLSYGRLRKFGYDCRFFTIMWLDCENWCFQRLSSYQPLHTRHETVHGVEGAIIWCYQFLRPNTACLCTLRPTVQLINACPRCKFLWESKLPGKCRHFSVHESGCTFTLDSDVSFQWFLGHKIW